MRSSDHQYWQIAAGAMGRDYTDAFLDYGMAFVGGDQQVDRMSYVEKGDIILLKRGTKELVAVGEVVERDGHHRGDGDKDWLLDFDGWVLRAYCFVRWHVPKSSVSVKGLTRGTISKVHVKRLHEHADNLLSSLSAKTDYLPEPKPTVPVRDEEILEFLIEQGLRPGAAEELTSTFRRIRLLAGYYYDQDVSFWSGVREHETRTFLVVPLLLALGWAEQQIKIEMPAGKGLRADLGCFSAPYRGDGEDKLVLLIETKGFSQGLDYAPEQALRYAESFPECGVVAVTNGYCYKVFASPSGHTDDVRPVAYLNLLRPRDRYPLDPENVDGCLKALKWLLP